MGTVYAFDEDVLRCAHLRLGALALRRAGVPAERISEETGVPLEVIRIWEDWVPLPEGGRDEEAPRSAE